MYPHAEMINAIFQSIFITARYGTSVRDEPYGMWCQAVRDVAPAVRDVVRRAGCGASRAAYLHRS